MSQSYAKYNMGIQYVCTGAVNFSTDVFLMVLSNTLPTAASSQYTSAGVAEIAAFAGYVPGSPAISITTTTLSNSSGVSTWVGTAALLTASASSPQFGYSILYDFTSASKPLLGYWACVTPITMASTDTFQVSWTSNQILQFS